MRDSRQDGEPESRFSARWWPVEELFQGSKAGRWGEAARGREGWWGGIFVVVEAVTERLEMNRKTACVDREGLGQKTGVLFCE